MNDVRLAFRTLRATPIISAVAVLSLGLGIGANTAIFSLINSVVLRSLPVSDPDRLVAVTNTARGPGTQWSFAAWGQIRERSQLFDGTLAYSPNHFTVVTNQQPRYIDGLYVSGGFFDVLGVRAFLGELFTEANDGRTDPSSQPLAVISHAFWRHSFHGKLSVVGQTILIERVPFTIAGVTPPSFHGLEVGRSFDVAVPLSAEPLLRRAESLLDRRDATWLTIMARTKVGQRIEDPANALRGVQRQIRDAAAPPGSRDALVDPFDLLSASGGNSSLRLRYSRPLLTVFTISGFVLLIACANVANLLLARAASRRHEFSVRIALGASGWRLARLLLTESALLSAAGAAVGVLLAQWLGPLLVGQLSTQVTAVVLDLTPDWRMLVFTTTVSVITVLLFGSAPAVHASRAEPIRAMKDTARTAIGGRRMIVANGLVVVQVAFSLMLVVAAGLFVRTFARLATSEIGFDRAGVLVVSINLQPAGTPPAERALLLKNLRNAALLAPGVSSAAIAAFAPISGGFATANIHVPGAEQLSDRERRTNANYVSPDWFGTYRTALLAGRDFSDGDRTESPAVAIVNKAFARKFFGGSNPVGKVIRQSATAPPRTIVGLVADAVYRSIREPMPATVYLPLAQAGAGSQFTFATLTVRTGTSDPMIQQRGVAAALAAANPEVAVTFRSLSDVVNGALMQERLLAILSAFFGMLALLLAALGLYGVTSYSVHRRRAEIGLRITLGAAPAGVVGMVLRRVMMLVVAGIVVGIAISVSVSRLIGTLLFELGPRDPATFAGAALLLAAIGALSGGLPALRAARLDPALALRDA